MKVLSLTESRNFIKEGKKKIETRSWQPIIVENYIFMLV